MQRETIVQIITFYKWNIYNLLKIVFHKRKEKKKEFQIEQVSHR